MRKIISFVKLPRYVNVLYRKLKTFLKPFLDTDERRGGLYFNFVPAHQMAALTQGEPYLHVIFILFSFLLFTTRKK